VVLDGIDDPRDDGAVEAHEESPEGNDEREAGDVVHAAVFLRQFMTSTRSNPPNRDTVPEHGASPEYL
jgi:hypothetical protein